MLADDSVEHGPLEVLLTMTEEAGMDGAFGLQPNWLQADILINTDSEEEGEIYMGCAGGIDFITTLPLQREAVPAGYQTLKLTLKGLKGGHSGAEIHVGLGNANKLLARFLFAHAAALNLRVLDLNGGTLRNAIPREASAVVAVPADKADALKALSQSSGGAAERTLRQREEHHRAAGADHQRFAGAERRQPATFPGAAERHAERRDPHERRGKGVVETSLNVGVVTTSENEAEIICLIRSLIDSGKDYVVEMLTALGQLAGAKVAPKGGYPGWQPDADSPVMHRCASCIRSCSTRRRTSW